MQIKTCIYCKMTEVHASFVEFLLLLLEIITLKEFVN